MWFLFVSITLWLLFNWLWLFFNVSFFLNVKKLVSFIDGNNKIFDFGDIEGEGAEENEEEEEWKTGDNIFKEFSWSVSASTSISYSVWWGDLLLEASVMILA